MSHLPGVKTMPHCGCAASGWYCRWHDITCLRGMGKSTATAKRKNKPANTFDAYKMHNGQFYTGMKVGKTHTWNYDRGRWQETKISPEVWRIFYSVTKRRVGKAPKGSGAKVGTGYHWYILAHQNVEKLNADDYSTTLSGIKLKIAHKTAGKKSWSAGTAAQRKELIEFLKGFIKQLQKNVIPLAFDYKGTDYNGEAIPIEESYNGLQYTQFYIALNGYHLGIVRALKSGWKMEGKTDPGLVKAIAAQLQG